MALKLALHFASRGTEIQGYDQVCRTREINPKKPLKQLTLHSSKQRFLVVKRKHEKIGLVIRPCGPSGLHKPSPFTSTYKEDDVYLFIFATFTILMQNIQPRSMHAHSK